MTEENPATATTETATTETPAPKPPEAKPRPAGYEPVDFDALNLTPEQRAAIEPRIHYLFGNVQAGKREREELRQWNERLQKDIESQEKRIQPLEQAQTEDRTARLAAALRTARDTGDVATEVMLLKEIAKPETKPEKPETKAPANGFEPLRPSVEAWAQETDDTGNLKRPWLAPDSPEHILAQGQLVQLTQDWQRSGMEVTPQTLPIFLQQLEAKMGRKPNGHAQTVLSTSQTRPPAKKTGDLTIEEMHHADKIMTHIKDRDERHKRYAAQKAQMRPR